MYSCVLTAFTIKRISINLPVVVLLQLVDELEMPLDVVAAAVCEREPHDPEHERVEGQRGDEQQPEVEEEEDLFVEEVDRQHALDVVAVDGAEPADFEVAHGDAREPRRGDGGRHGRRPVAAHLDDPADGVDAVAVERNAEEGVEQEQLAHDVGEVEALDDRVGDDQIVAAMTSTPAADRPSETALHAQRTSGFIPLRLVAL